MRYTINVEKIHEAGKHINTSDLKKFCDKLHTQNKKIVFTVGTFDLIHSGHAAYLLGAKSYGDILIVGVATNKSRKRLRGKGFPLIDQKNRAELIEYFKFVDNTVYVDKQNILPILKKIKPDIFYGLGIDFRSHLRKKKEADFIKSYGGKIINVKKSQPFVSASAIVERVADLKIKEIIEYFFGKVKIDLSKGDWKKKMWSGLKTDVRSERLDFGNHSKKLSLFERKYFGEIVDEGKLPQISSKLKSDGRKIVLASGACDLLHAGHARFFNKAKSYGDVLVLAIPSNDVIFRQKGRGRPIVDEYSRAELMAYFGFVDYIVIFDHDEITPVIEKLSPDIFFTVVEDWNQIDKSSAAALIKKIGGQIITAPPQAPTLSSSRLIRKAAGIRVRQVFKEVLDEAEKWTSLKD
ncbi:hypothetical protein CO058_01990 [candidate division WWE3 bacterium CG_4_9_14_0_2_um_filter_35_11]|uniref:Cytidyltransferase-like domain-containing protein n=1 Tax=candidate division WWE3 bacterium CG_4_9_14_0_2_um_filter_35_11 TaxID=1975077 RepID=A0A2M8ELV2_UNCKA|nr:MAG: hypothetical protein COV25_03360 [candidate division WWE3 bacterium CG10_big_fil_rev_8_21_14_0_10_35_32]PJC23711.1 MAG: hypothetical protein CO058_01990 [candidate division WWE3 bacterium CG_4_9_14_0_2_um_filter_35_11]